VELKAYRSAGDEGAVLDEAEEEHVEFNFSVVGDVAFGGAEVVAVEPVGEDGGVANEAAEATGAQPSDAVQAIKAEERRFAKEVDGNGLALAGAPVWCPFSSTG
jgi:hypothetical protein